MTAEQLINAVDALKPNAFTMEQKLAWIDEMESTVWQEIMLRSAGEGEQSNVMQRELLLPESYKQLYVLYTAAMIDFFNAEYTRYSNAMAAYNSALQSFAARYAEIYAPADCPAVWVDAGSLTYNVAGGKCRLGTLPRGAAVLAAEVTVQTAFNAAANALCLGTERREDAFLRGADVPAEITGRYFRRGFYVPAEDETELYALYRCSGTATAGAAAFRLLIQPGKEG